MSEIYKGSTIKDWAEAATIVDKSLQEYLSDDKMAGLAALNEMNLPKPKGTLVAATEYLKNPIQYFDNLKSPDVYINIIPDSNKLKKMSIFAITKEEGLKYIAHNLPVELIDHYNVGVHEYYPNVYGGNLLINQNGHIFIEFGEGSNVDYSKCNKIPAYKGVGNSFTGFMHYDFEEPELRELSWDILSSIPHDEDGVRINFRPGYYEFSVYRDPKNVKLKPVFLDYKDNIAYQFKTEQTDTL